MHNQVQQAEALRAAKQLLADRCQPAVHYVDRLCHVGSKLPSAIIPDDVWSSMMELWEERTSSQKTRPFSA
jgi:hypothetical protein